MARKPSNRRASNDTVKEAVVAPEKDVTPPSAEVRADAALPDNPGAKSFEEKTVEIDGAPLTFGIIKY